MGEDAPSIASRARRRVDPSHLAKRETTSGWGNGCVVNSDGKLYLRTMCPPWHRRQEGGSALPCAGPTKYARARTSGYGRSSPLHPSRGGKAESAPPRRQKRLIILRSLKFEFEFDLEIILQVHDHLETKPRLVSQTIKARCVKKHKDKR